MARTKKAKEAVENNQKVDKDVKSNPVVDACEAAKTKFKDVVIVGLTDDDLIDVIPSTPYYSHINHILNRGLFEILIHEKSVITQRLQEGQ